MFGLATSSAAAPRQELTLHEGWRFRQVGQEAWLPATVPGSVHLDLLQNGSIPDPFDRDNETSQQWIGKTDWEYRLEFPVTADVLARRQVDLVFEGLDTYASVFLNGKQLLAADNMYRRWRVPVTGRLEATGNVLRIEFRSPINEVLPRKAALAYELPAANDAGEKTSPFTRKAPYQFGWDWGPRFVTCGIWKPVRLEAWDDARIADVWVRQRALTDSVARLTAEIEVVTAARAGATPASLVVEVAAPAGAAAVPGASTRLAPGAGSRTYSVELAIPQPKRWWPNGLGDQPLYRVDATLLQGSRAVDAANRRIGLRTLELRRQADAWGKSFEFVVNDVPVFAKGANWIPADSFPTRVTRARYADLLRSARDVHMNMLRVWGGGLYESDDFYDLADEMGLLVWQDFHFSCSLYPADQAFLDNVKAEAEDVVRRLRNHASLALWNGNNEVETAWWQWGWRLKLPGSLWGDYEKLFHELLPEVVGRLDPDRAYWPSSPSARREAEPGSPENGDAHYWGVWHMGQPFQAFETQITRFMSEYGFQAFPELKTIRAFAREEDLALESPVMLSHQKNARGNALIREYMLRDYREPKDFPAFLYLSQVLQAEGIKVGAEHLRRMRPRTMGSLYWQLNDCWPVASWSSIDYFGRWKALHHYARRFYGDLLVSTQEEGAEIGVHVTSDLREPTAGVLRLRLLDLDGAVLWERRAEVTAGPLASARQLALPTSTLLAGREPDRVFLHAELFVGDSAHARSSNTRFFVPMKRLALRRPAITTRVTPADGGFRVELSADTLARNVRLAFPAGEGSFSDNFIDLIPGQPAVVTWRGREAVTLEAFERGLELFSLADASAPETPRTPEP